MDVKRWLRTQWDRVTAWVLIALGALALLLGWAGVADTPFPAEQIPFVVSGGIGGALLVGLGAALLLSADARDEWQKLDRIEQALTRAAADEAPARDDIDDIAPRTTSPRRSRPRRPTAGKGPRP
jgi:hypothetical protein